MASASRKPGSVRQAFTSKVMSARMLQNVEPAISSGSPVVTSLPGQKLKVDQITPFIRQPDEIGTTVDGLGRTWCVGMALAQGRVSSALSRDDIDNTHLYVRRTRHIKGLMM